MTYEEAVKIKREWLKDSIRRRLHEINPDKYPPPARTRIWSVIDVAEIWEVISTIQWHEKGHPFERDDVFLKYLK